MNTGGPELYLATTNPGKVAEIRDLLAEGWPTLSVQPRPPGMGEVVEDAPDFEGNARKKALAVMGFRGAPALADDSGLVVDALHGAPGVHSARYAGERATDADNLARLTAEMAGVGASERTARFVCVMVLATPVGGPDPFGLGQDLLVTRGTVEGRLADSPKGESGFGYDPLFVPDEGDGRTFAEMMPAEKNEISHRGRALKQLIAKLRPATPPGG